MLWIRAWKITDHPKNERERRLSLTCVVRAMMKVCLGKLEWLWPQQSTDIGTSFRPGNSFSPVLAGPCSNNILLVHYHLCSSAIRMLPTTRLRLMICIAIAVLRAEEVLELVPQRGHSWFVARLGHGSRPKQTLHPLLSWAVGRKAGFALQSWKWTAREMDLSDQALQLLFASWGVGSRLVAAYLDSWGREPRGIFDYLKRIWVLLRVQPCQCSQKLDQLVLNRQALSQSLIE